MFWVNKYLLIGIGRKTPSEIALIIRTANIVNAILLTVFLAFSAMFFFVAPELSIITVAGSAVIFVSVVLLAVRFTVASRILTVITVPICAVFFYGALLYGQADNMPRVFAGIAVISLFPWFLFTPKEFAYSLVTFLFNFGLILFAADIAVLIPFQGDYSVMRSMLMQNLILCMAFLVVSAVIFGLQTNNRNESAKVRGLLLEREREQSESFKKEQELRNVVSQLTLAQQDEKKRAWATTGMAEIGKILREEQESIKLADRLINYLVKYIAANQGALFTIKEQNSVSYFSLLGCYAYDRKKFIEKEISVNNGLIGECFQSRSHIYIKEVPKDYVHITSGLGYATPRALLIIPILTNEKVFGVMEFASFTPIEDHVITFLLDVGENMGTVFNNLKNAERTNELLRETREMTEQMRAQEEEMRQNMEELVSMQEHQARVEEELRQTLISKDDEISQLRGKLELNIHHEPMLAPTQHGYE